MNTKRLAQGKYTHGSTQSKNIKGTDIHTDQHREKIEEITTEKTFTRIIAGKESEEFTTGKVLIYINT